MCGIAGYVSRDAAAPASRELVQAMCDVMVHRGPDDEGFLPETLVMVPISMVELYKKPDLTVNRWPSMV